MQNMLHDGLAFRPDVQYIVHVTYKERKRYASIHAEGS